MKMRQREILNSLNLDFARDNETNYIERKMAEIKTATREYLKKTGMKGFVIGLSGGIDSFVTACLAADAVESMGAPVNMLIMPNGTQKDIADAEECRDVILARFENAMCETVSIEHAYSGLLMDLKASEMFDEGNVYAIGNSQARLRMVEQYALGSGYLILGTDHATENITGYFTKYGDGGTDFNPMDGLLKPDIYAIGKLYGAPKCVMKKKPAAGLGISSCDEEELGLTYDEIASYLKGNLIEREKMQKLVSLYEKGMHKRRMPASPINDWWRGGRGDVTHIVVDMIHAFTDGALACEHADEAIGSDVDFIDSHPEMRVLYVKDCHPQNHCSFVAQGGQWPPHAVIGTAECSFDERFYGLKKTINTPINRYNVFLKGTEQDKEEYSGFNAKNPQYGALKYNITPDVLVSGIATEYCVKNTVEDLLKNGFRVSVLKRALGWVDENDHAKALAEMEAMGAKIV